MSTVADVVRVILQLATEAPDMPLEPEFRRWVNAACGCAGSELAANSSVTVRIVDEAESGELNRTFRNVAKSTNVLAFPADRQFAGINADDEVELGDLVICAPVVLREAREQAKSATAHFAHMTVHGCMHLLGYDHLNERDADEMETLEVQALAGLGFPDPYAGNNQDLRQA